MRQMCEAKEEWLCKQYGVMNMTSSRTAFTKRPCCPECREPIGLDGDKLRCYSCGKVVKVTDPEMLKWISERAWVKYVYQECRECGGTMMVKYVRNPATLEWQEAQGKCENCGLAFIV